jgi:hypothetical protein
MTVECIKGFVLGGSLAVMQGEIFQLVDAEENTFEGLVDYSRCPGMEIDFTEEELANNFKLIKS